MNNPTIPSTARNWGMLALIGGALAISFAPVLAKLASDYEVSVASIPMTPVAVAFWRVAIATPIMIWYLLRQKNYSVMNLVRRHSQENRSVANSLLWLFLPGIIFAVDLGVWHSAFEYTSVANATLEANLSAVIVPIASWYLWKERFDRYFVVGTILAVVSLGGLVGASFGGGGEVWIGDLLGILTAFAYASFQLANKKLSRHFPVPVIMGATAFSCSLCLLVYCLITGEAIMPNHLNTWLILLGLALICQIAGQGLIVYAFSKLNAGVASVTLLVQPVGAAFLGWLMLSQNVKPSQLIFGFMVLLGIAIGKRSYFMTGRAPKSTKDPANESAPSS